MALFNKLFSTGKKRSTSSSTQKCTAGQFPFATDQIRVILFRECDIRGRKLLFDSSAVERIPDGPSAGIATATAHTSSVHHKSIPQAQKCDHCKVLYQHNTNPKSDIKPLSEMIFGSAPIAFQGSSLKVHWLKMPKSIMCSHVFPTPVRNTASSSNSNKKVSLANYLGSELPGGGHGVSYYDRHPSVSDLSSMDTNSLRSFTVTSSTSTQHDISYTSRQRPPLPLEFGHIDRMTDPRLSTNSGMDSGYGGTDPWAYSSGGSRHPLSSHRSSLASICSDYECFRRLSTDTSIDIPQVVSCASLDDCSQFGSFHRRVSKNLTTSFENRLSLADHIGHIDDLSSTGGTTSSQATASDGCVGGRNRRNSETVETNRRKAFSGELLSTATNYQGRPPSKKARLGIALCIQLNESMTQEMEAFCSEHMSVFESMLCRLRVAAEKACYRWQQFLQIMLAAWHSTQQWLVDFFTAPRLVNPVWITLSSGVYSNSNANWNRSCLTIANDFMNDLCSLLSIADTKDTNLFISTLLTAVLTHHLGWVSTIAPISGSDDGADTSSCNSVQREKDKISKITANHPYNVLWAQLGDLYGAVGHPVKLSKTIICGSPQMSNTIEKILNVLSYFIRCSEIKRTAHVEIFEENKVNEAFASQRIINSTSSPEFFSEQGTSKENFPRMTRTGSGMVRSGTIMKDLTAIERTSKAADSEQYSMLKKNVMNDIPNVLVYRDSRFVQQELRIGNKSMDTELLMNAREKQFLEMIYHIKKGNGAPPVRMTLTQPDETGQEAIELDVNDTDDVESVRLSKLITETNIGDGENGQRFLWGIERIRNELPMDQMKYIDGLRGDYDMLVQSKPKEDVVFVLGENEKLVNIRHVNSSSDEGKSSELGAVGGRKSCSHSRLRRHSVIFNFDRYPKVVENYWKSQHLDMTEHGFQEKAMKLDMALKMNMDGETSVFDPSEEECDVCRNASFLYLQTPTNASELEFSCDLNEGSSISSFHNSASKSSLEEELRKYPGVQLHDNIPKVHATAMATLEEHPELRAKHPDSILKLMDIPMSKATSAASLNDENNNDKTEKRLHPRAGFMPSLFSRVSDHYIPDMILQGTTAQPSKWEKALKKDLSFASRFALMEQYPVENLAVVANLETHDVRLITSHSSSLAPISPDGDLVGMSQLVSSMLETVHAMWSSGMSAFQCMAFIESKLRELYLHSETIASFLLATDFCTIGSVTSALDITANDMPLLLSVASIHAPEVTRRYGIQFR